VSSPAQPGDDVPGAPPPLLADRHRTAPPHTAGGLAPAAGPDTAQAGPPGYLVPAALVVGGAVAVLVSRRRRRAAPVVAGQEP
jgi:hypothetical protein